MEIIFNGLQKDAADEFDCDDDSYGCGVCCWNCNVDQYKIRTFITITLCTAAPCPKGQGSPLKTEIVICIQIFICGARKGRNGLLPTRRTIYPFAIRSICTGSGCNF